MPKSYLLRRCVAFFILLAAVVFGEEPKSAAVPPSPAAVDELLTQLDKRAAAASGTEAMQFADMLARVRAAIRSNQFDQAGATVGYLRASPVARAPENAALLDQLQAVIEKQSEAQTRTRNATLESIQSDTAARFRAHAPASDYDALLQRLAAIPAGPMFNSDSVQKINDLRSFISGCQDYTAALGRHDTMAANSALYGLAQVASRLPVIPRSELVALRSDAATPSPATDELAAQVGAFRPKVAAALDHAQAPADLDGLLQEMAQAKASARGSAIGTQLQFDQLQRLVRRWQDFLGLQTSDWMSAQNVLRELLSSPDLEAFYPRSKVIARLNALQSGAAQKATLMPPSELTLATLDTFMRQVSAIPRGSPMASAIPGIDGIFTRGERLRMIAAEVAAGNTQSALMLPMMQSFSPAGDYASAFDRVGQELVGKAIAVAVRAPAELARKSGESLIDYLERVVAYGRGHQDWELVHRAIMAEQAVAPMESRMIGSTQGYSMFFAAQNAEKVGHWSQAVRYYESALRGSGENLPADEIAKRLDAIKADHPDEYAQAERAPMIVDYGGGSVVLPGGRSSNFPPVVRPHGSPAPRVNAAPPINVAPPTTAVPPANAAPPIENPPLPVAPAKD